VTPDPAIRIVDPDPGWPAAAQAELHRLAEALGPVAVRLDHVGSTAVPGLPAKPVVDLQVSVAALEPAAAYVEPLERLGYLHVPYDGYPFFGRPRARPRTHHVHVCASGSHNELRHLAVRDFLRTHPEEARAYATLKREVAARHPGDREGYMAGKDAYVLALEERALRWAAG
jgi:GrpB-like predicted nucleotidyltransferase (UPF0157 family)